MLPPDRALLQRRRSHAPHLAANRVLGIASVSLLFITWWFLSANNMVNPLFLPGPDKVWDAFVTTATTGYQGATLTEHIAESLKRILAGFSLACVVGIPLGLIMGVSRHIRAFFDPLIEIFRPLPPLGIYTLLVMWLGIGETSKVALLFLAGLPVLIISAMEAVKGIDPAFVRAARSLGAKRSHLLRHVYTPGCLPEIQTGMRIALGFTYTVLVAAEIVAAPAGLGWLVWDASKFLMSDVVIMGLLVLAVTGFALDRVLRALEVTLTPWRRT
ncbi:MAG TPA: ABC transporter permease subunit [Hyphomicrobium sp.]|nr:ABC transporter permease subunit [Hyphomicrobium sp.]